jgi:simple sugar transport system permease protein
MTWQIRSAVGWGGVREKRPSARGARLAFDRGDRAAGAAIGALLILATGPIRWWLSGLVVSAFGRVNGFAETMVKACPLLLAGLGVTIAFRAKFWNIGAEGQITPGASSRRSWYLSDRPAGDHHLPLTVLAGALGGALWGFFPAT